MSEKRIHSARCDCTSSGKRTVISGAPIVYSRHSEMIRDVFGSFRERFLAGAFGDYLRGNPDIRALVNHQDSMVLGRTRAGTLRLADGPEQLGCEIDPPDTTYARDLMVSLRRGDINQMSFAFDCDDEEWGEGEFDGEMCALRTVKRAKLYEVSPVTFPAYPDTQVGLGERSKRSLEKFLGKKKAPWRFALLERLLSLEEKA